MGAILAGWALSSEAAALGSFGSVVPAVVYCSISMTKRKERVFLTARTSAMVCWLFVGSSFL